MEMKRYYEKLLQKTNSKEFIVEKLIRRKVDQLYAKWKYYANSFNSWISKNLYEKIYII